MERTTAPAVVVPGTAAGCSLACVRSLGRRGLRPIVAGVDSVAAGSTFCDRAVPIPDPRTDLAGYADSLLDLTERESIETVLPLGDAATRVLTKNRELFAERVATPWACRTGTEVLLDRGRLFTLAREAGVPVPTTTVSTDNEPAESATTDGPADGAATSVNGPKRGATTSDGGRVMDAAGRTPGPAPTPASTDAGHMARDPHDDLGLFALFDEGEPLAWLGFHRRRVGTNHPGGVYRETVHDEALRDHGLTLLSELKWHGPATVTFGRDRNDDTLRLRDATPRFDCGLPLALAAGVDLPWLHYRLAAGDPPAEPPDYDNGVGCHDLCAEWVALVRRVLGDRERSGSAATGGDVARTIAFLVGQPNFDYLRATDPRPFIDRVASFLVGDARSVETPERR